MASNAKMIPDAVRTAARAELASGNHDVAIDIQPARVLAARDAVDHNGSVRSHLRGPTQELAFRFERGSRRNGLSPTIVGR